MCIYSCKVVIQPKQNLPWIFLTYPSMKTMKSFQQTDLIHSEKNQGRMAIILEISRLIILSTIICHWSGPIFYWGLGTLALMGHCIFCQTAEGEPPLSRSTEASLCSNYSDTTSRMPSGQPTGLHPAMTERFSDEGVAHKRQGQMTKMH